MEFNRRVLVTGGVSGIGGAVAEAFAEQGAEIIVLTLPEPRHSGETKHFASPEDAALFANRRRGDSSIRVVEGDAANLSDVSEAVELAESLGGVDILVCNAATNAVHPVVDHDVELWQRVIAVNLVGPFLLMRACLPGMLRRNYGRIVSIASVASHVGLPSYSAYCASKHGLLGLHRSVAREIQGRNVTVNTVSPGLVDTPSARLHLELASRERGISYEEALREELASTQQERALKPSEIAAVVLFLCGPGGSSIHGADIAVRGGAIAG